MHGLPDNTNPPKWADTLLELCCADRFLEEIQGDLHEWFHKTVERKSLRKAKLLYALNVLRSLKTFRLRSLQSFILFIIDRTMLQNYFKVAIRNVFNHKFFSLINLTGLTFGIASCLFIYFYVKNELSYDSFHQHKDNIYRVVQTNPKTGTKWRSAPTPLGPALHNEFPGIVMASMGEDPVFVELQGSKFYEPNFYWTDSTFFDVFSFPLKSGNPSKALAEPNCIVLTEKIAKKYFKDENPMGKVINVKIYDGDKILPMKITGIAEDPPPNSHIQFDILGSMISGLELYKQFENHWGFNWLKSYVLLESKNDVERIKSQIPDMIDKYLGEGFSEQKGLYFQPLKEVYLHSKDINNKDIKGSIEYVYIFSIVGIFILAIASINFVNLSTARLTVRGKEVGVRKTVGALKSDLIKQFLSESFLLALTSILLALILVVLLWPFFIELIEKEIALEILFSWENLTALLIILFITGILSGTYPAFILSAFKPINALKRATSLSKRGNTNLMRRLLVIFQFGISIFLIVGSLVIYSQLNYMIKSDLGFEKDQLISVPVEDRGLQKRIDILKDEMGKVQGVEKITASGESLPSFMNNTWSFSWDEASEEAKLGIDVVAVDSDYFETIGVKLKEGRNFNKSFHTDSARSFILNNAAVKRIGWASALEKEIQVGGRKRKVIGVVEDFHHFSLKHNVRSTAYFIAPPGNRVSNDNLIIKVSSNDMVKTIEGLSDVWDRFSTEQVFDFKFVDDAYDQTYKADQRFFMIFGFFSVIGILIACVGLFGMVVHMTEQRSREVSIRKVLGASFHSIVVLLSKEFTRLIAFAFLIAGPLAYISTDRWLQQYPHRIDVTIWIVLLAGLLAFLISWITIGFNTIKAAIANPVRYLRNE
ncbi:ABC transporter permease [Fulvivirgaceae bacterium BMA10]|uniref:ABC transporter permease n=1 Tax=Splendidivirga corallicola TaxID=3051826 RepID=A0ABT8KHY4_9BACT|nr:ABC transporter permease [Fulvivirgaceae bacterium BMA10]